MDELNQILIGSLVMVIVEHPDGCDNTETYGDIGVVTKIEKVTDKYDYTVHNINSDYLYGAEQLRLLTDEECREALYSTLINNKTEICIEKWKRGFIGGNRNEILWRWTDFR